MDYMRRPSVSHSFSGQSKAAESEQRDDSSVQPVRHNGKGDKGRWLSQIKDWISISEPSTQALKHYKKDAYKRAGISMNDPQASAKLHIPSTTLPSGAIKPSGRGPEPEDIARRNAEKRKLRRSYQTLSNTSAGSRSSASHHSSRSSIRSHDFKEDV